MDSLEALLAAPLEDAPASVSSTLQTGAIPPRASEPPLPSTRDESELEAQDEEFSPPSLRSTLSLFEREAVAPWFFVILFLSMTGALVYVLQDFIRDLVIAFILLGLFNPIYEWLVPRVRSYRWFASGLTTLFVFLVMVVPVLALGYTIALEAANAYGLASSLFADGGAGVFEKTLSHIEGLGLPLTRETILVYITELSTAVQGALVSWGGEILSNALAITVHLAVVLVLFFYLLVDGPRLKKFVFELSPLPDDEDALLVETFKKVSKGVIVGNGLGSVLQGALGGIAMWMAGLPSPVLWGAVMSIFAFLPLVGISIVAIPAGLYLFLSGQVASAVGFLIFCTVQGLFVENVVKTKLMGSAMRMHDVLVFLSILGGLSAFGIFGIVYGPLIAMMFITLSDLYARRYRPQLARRYWGRSS